MSTGYTPFFCWLEHISLSISISIALHFEYLFALLISITESIIAGSWVCCCCCCCYFTSAMSLEHNRFMFAHFLFSNNTPLSLGCIILLVSKLDLKKEKQAKTHSLRRRSFAYIRALYNANM